LETHKFWNVESEARIEPPIQTEYLRSGGATILTCTKTNISHINAKPRIPFAELGMRKRKTNLDARWSKRREFLLHTIGDTWEHGGSTRNNNVAVELTADIKITLVDRVVAV
jgi:hypothetical protein